MPSHLESCISCNDVNTIEDHLKGPRKLPIDIRNKQSETVIMIACKSKAIHSLKSIIEIMTEDHKNETIIDAVNTKGQSALHLASMNGFKEAVVILLHQNYKSDCCIQQKKDFRNIINLRDQNGYTALHFASQNGHLEPVKVMCDKGANIEAQNRWKGTALHLASENGHHEVVKVL